MLLRLSRKIQVILPLFIVILLGFIPASWTIPGLVFKGDLNVPLNPIIVWQNSLYLWSQQLYGGQGQMGFINLAYNSFWAFFSSLNFPLRIVEALWFATISIVSGFSMYFFLSVVLDKQSRNINIAKMMGSVFYAFNLYVMVLSPITVSYACLIMFLPLMVGLFLQGLNENRLVVKNAFFLGLVLTLSSAALYNFPILLIIFPVLFFYHVFNTRKPFKYYLIFCLVNLLIVTLINFWFLLPTALLVTNQEGVTLSGQTTDFNNVIANSTHTTVLHLFQQLGSWGFYSYHRGEPYFAYAPFFLNNRLLIVLTFLPILYTLGVLLKNKSRDKNVLMFALLLIVSLFLSHGVYTGRPFSFVFKLLYRYVPGFITFRDPNKLGIITMLCFSYFFAAFAVIINNSLRKKINIFVANLVLFMLILVTVWPMITGSVIEPTRGKLPDEHVQVPKYWQETGKAVDANTENSKIFVFPMVAGYLRYKWEYHGSEFIPVLFRKPALLGVHGYFFRKEYSEVVNLLSEAHLRMDEGLKILGMLNVRHVLIRNDIDSSYYGIEYDKQVSLAKKVLEDNNIARIGSWGELELFRIPDEYYRPVFYTPDEQVYSGVRLKDFYSLSEISEYFTDKQDTGYYFKDGTSVPPPEYLNGPIILKPENKYLEDIDDGIFINEPAVNYPIVKKLPDDFWLSFEFKLEEINNQVRGGEAVARIDRNLLYANKRIVEITKFHPDLETTRKLLLVWEKNIASAIDPLPEIEGEDFLKNVNKVKTNIANNYSLLRKWLPLEELEKEKIKVAAQVNRIDSYVNSKFNPENYQLDVPQTGKYKILTKNLPEKVDKTKTSKHELPASDINIEISGSDVLFDEPEDIGGGWSKIGSTVLTSGVKEITISLKKDKNNLLASPDLSGKMAISGWQPGILYKFGVCLKENIHSLSLNLIQSTGKVTTTLISNSQLIPTAYCDRYYDFYVLSENYTTGGEIRLEDIVYNNPLAVEENDIFPLENLTITPINKSEIFFVLDRVNSTNNVVSNNPGINIRKINPTKYKIRVEGASSNYNLIFSEGFDKNWKIYLDEPNTVNKIISHFLKLAGVTPQKFENEEVFFDSLTFETIGRKNIAEERHYQANGYVNSWFIKPSDVQNLGNYELIIEYRPQRYFYLGIGISCFSIICLLTYLGYSYFLKGKLYK
ncbi:DUF3367 domain-containing protein [Candidatus Microgenomates bacterium]|jgi:hypothetical protein|nr:MAG: DUF3367 domain-containing protein [Candidatus Microgenomates bacterium]